MSRVYKHSPGMISVRVDTVGAAALEAVKKTELFKSVEGTVGPERAAQVASAGGRARAVRADHGPGTPR